MAAAAKKTPTTPNPLLKTYGERPVPFQFPDNPEKMYIGSEVNNSFNYSIIIIIISRLVIIYVYFVEHFIKNILHYGVV